MTVIHYEISEAPTLAEASEFSKYIEDQRHVAAEIRRQTVSKAIRTGTKAAEVAFELGVSKTRVSQLFHEDASHSESLHEDEDQRELELSGAATAE
jgi:predicted transcriptional regulator